MRLALCLVLATLLAASPAMAAGTREVHWDSRVWELRASGLPAAALADRPDWADRQVVLDGKILWVVAILPPSVEAWSDRLHLGSRQAESTLHAFADYLVRARTAQDPVDYRERQATSVRYRLKTGLDPEGFLKIETLERPRAVWMRFGYPADKVERALGFDLPGALALDFPPRDGPRKAEEGSGREVSIWDTAFELTWLTGVVSVTVAAVLFAQALQK